MGPSLENNYGSNLSLDFHWSLTYQFAFCSLVHSISVEANWDWKKPFLILFGEKLIKFRRKYSEKFSIYRGLPTKSKKLWINQQQQKRNSLLFTIWCTQYQSWGWKQLFSNLSILKKLSSDILENHFEKTFVYSTKKFLNINKEFIFWSLIHSIPILEADWIWAISDLGLWCPGKISCSKIESVISQLQEGNWCYQKSIKCSASATKNCKSWLKPPIKMVQQLNRLLRPLYWS